MGIILIVTQIDMNALIVKLNSQENMQDVPNVIFHYITNNIEGGLIKMMAYLSEKTDENIVYDEKYYEDLAKRLAEESIINFRKDLNKIFSE